MTREAARTRDIAAYGLPNLVAALPIIPIAVLLPSWYAENTNLSLLGVGLALTLARVLDFFSDVAVGILVDRTISKRWRYKPWIMLGTVVACAALFALALPPQEVSVTYLASWAAILFAGWTMITVPYTAWGAELMASRHDRSRLTLSRELAGIFGIIGALSLPLFFPQIPNVLYIIAVAAALCAIPAVAVCFACLADIPAGPLQTSRAEWSDVVALLRIRPFRRTALYWLLNSIANSLPAVLFPIVVTAYFGLDDKQLYQLLLVYFGSAVVFAPLWIALSKHCGKLYSWRLALFASVFAFLPALGLGVEQSHWFTVVCIFTGATLAADLALPASIQADVLEFDRVHYLRRRSGAAFALWSMSSKLALAIAVGGAFLALHLLGVDASNDLNQLEKHRLLLLYVGVPVVLKVMLIVLAREPILESDFEREALTRPSTQAT